MEQSSESLVTLLESCLNHNLKPSQKEEDPPHAKISSDIISCMFLVSIKLFSNWFIGIYVLCKIEVIASSPSAKNFYYNLNCKI